MTTVLTVRLDDDLSDALTQRATDRNMTKAKLVRKLIANEIANNSMREDNSIAVLDIDELDIIKKALEVYLPDNNTTPESLALYLYLCGQLSELQHSIGSRPYTY